MILQYTFSPYHWIYMLVGGIVLIVVNLLIAKYMHKDAIKRDIKNSEFWLVMGFFLSVIGLLLYVFVRKNYEERK
ncbi:MAG: hypothetical protein KAW66_11015 [Candidatus Lokiarchaeota archaeon]|nr:hypothetical protein [Candidatus Lokiarchaeota archaeon]